MQHFTEDDFKKIIARRDRRFDGRFYFGVKTTRIYCRPVCPAKPKPENIIIFKSATEAERNGYRACMRCRPDAAPASKFLDGTLNTVSRALRIIEDSFDDDLTVESLSDSLGVTSRHLRRLFQEHLGASPVEILITQKLHFAKQVVQMTRMPMLDIAFAAGFQSTRRFNEAFKARFHRSPSMLRAKGTIAHEDSFAMQMPVRAPYDWKQVIGYLKRHESYGVERIADSVYYRYVPQKNSYGTAVVSFQEKRNSLNVEFFGIGLKQVRKVLSRLQNLFDTTHNPTHLPRSKVLKPEGVRVPGAFDPFETAISIILSQLISTEHAKFKIKALIGRFGTVIGKDGSYPVYAFPSAAVLSGAALEDLGVPNVRAAAVRHFSEAVRTGRIDFSSCAEFSEIRAACESIKGIGPWTAEMIAMRCLGDPDAFPENDLIVQRANGAHLYDHEAWVSSRAYLTHTLWRDFSETFSKKKKGREE